MPKRAAVFVVTAALWLCASPLSQAAGEDASARAFVQAFYDWYVTVKVRPSEAALATRPEAFRDDLRLPLDAELRAQAELTPEAAAAVDWDPFTWVQKPCDRYEAREVLHLDGAWRVNVHGMCRDGDHEMPDVIAVVVREDGAWRFTNFEYPEDGNLVEILKPSAEGGQ